MFSYFHEVKFLGNKKGQLVPVFIVVLVILIIMAFVTVNLSKVALFKTESSNAADAGGLATGAVMANIFNGIAQANSQMETYYWEFYATISASFAIALVYLIAAHVWTAAALIPADLAAFAGGTAESMAVSAANTACVNPCSAIALADAAAVWADAAAASMYVAAFDIGKAAGDMGGFITAAWGLLISIVAFAAAQQYLYANIRKMADEGRDEAIKMGHKFSFMNANIGSKLKADKPDDTVTDQQIKNNYRDIYSNFLDDSVGYNDEYVYSWLDGQERTHSVKNRIEVDEVDAFDLRVTALPSIVEVPLIGMIIASASTTEAALLSLAGLYGVAGLWYTIAGIDYMAAAVMLKATCICFNCRGAGWPVGVVCTACYVGLCAASEAIVMVGIAANTPGIAKNAAAIVENGVLMGAIAALYVPLGIAHAGLSPGYVVPSKSVAETAPFIPCWLEEVVHDHMVTTTTTQSHQGQDFAVWETKYPDTSSYSVVDFSGQGNIHDPVLRYDASIVETDSPEATFNFCPTIVKNVTSLEMQAVELVQAADGLEANATKIEDEANILMAAGNTAAAEALMKNVKLIRDDAVVRRAEAVERQAEADNIKNANMDCFVR